MVILKNGKKSTAVSKERHLESTGHWNGAATFQYEHGSKLMGGAGQYEYCWRETCKEIWGLLGPIITTCKNYWGSGLTLNFFSNLWALCSGSIIANELI